MIKIIPMLIFLLFYSLCSFASEDHIISMYDNTVNIEELKEALKGSGKQYLLDRCDSIEKKEKEEQKGN